VDGMGYPILRPNSGYKEAKLGISATRMSYSETLFSGRDYNVWDSRKSQSMDDDTVSQYLLVGLFIQKSLNNQ